MIRFFMILMKKIYARIISFVFIQIGAVAKLKPLELELQKLEDLSASVVEDFEYMRKREQAMRDTNGKNSCSILINLSEANDFILS